MSFPGHSTRTGPLPYQSNRGPTESSGRATNPSSDIEKAAITVAIGPLLPFVGRSTSIDESGGPDSSGPRHSPHPGHRIDFEPTGRGGPMANMVEEILGQIDPDELASRVGTDPETAMDAARKALPALLGGLDLEVQGGKADALAAAALQDHEGRLDQPNPLASVDPAEGQKILGHMFGDRLGTVEQRLGGTSQAGSSIFSKLLPILAPLVMSWLAGRMRGATKPSGGGGGGGGLDDQIGR